jgi:short-subunit dehydrogenase
VPGIGRAQARIAAAEGREVLLVGRNAVSLAALSDSLGPAAYSVPLDLRRLDAASQIGATLSARGLRCEISVNNAGVGLIGPMDQVPAHAQLDLVALNVRAPMALILAALPSMRAHGSGGVLNIGSVAGSFPGPNMAAYFASKAFLRSFSEALWAEGRSTGVQACCLVCGPVNTAFFDRAAMGAAPLYQLLPRASAERTARRAWEGLRHGQRIIVPDVLRRALLLLLRAAPRATVLRLLRRLHKSR